MAPLLENREGVSIIVQSREHLPPHIYATYGEDEALINIRTGQIIEGYISNTKLRIVQEWLDEGKNRINTEENFYELNPSLRPRLEKDVKPSTKTFAKQRKIKKKGGK